MRATLLCSLALASLASLAPVARAERVSPGGKLRTKDAHVLGIDREVALAVTADVVRLVSNIGTVDKTSLVLPDERFPQIAIVAALDADDAIVDWLAIPLAAQARVKVETTRGASVVVRVADRESAPLVATRGVLSIPVVVPPGVTAALAIATAKNGNVTEKPIALGTHPFVQTLAVCTPRGVSVFAIDGGGAPASLAPAITTTSGTASAPRVRGSGWFEVDVVADVDALTIAAGASLPSRCTITLPPIAPSSVRLVADRARHVAGDAPIALRVELDYRGARSRVTPTIEITADTGTVTTIEGGGRWALRAARAGKSTARARVIARWPGGSLEHTVEVALAAAAPAHLTIAPMSTISADGAAQADVVVDVVDRFGNPVPAARLRARARGKIGAFTRRADGRFVARYTAPRSRVATADRIEIASEDLGRAVTAVMRDVRVPLEPMPRRFATGVRAGMLSTTSAEVSPLVAVTAEVRLPIKGDRFALGVDAGVVSNSFDVMATAERVTGTVTTAPLLGRAALHQRWGKLDTWLGAGAGVALISTRIESASAGAHVELTMRPCATGFVGAAYRLGWGSLGLEVGYLHATLPGDGDVQGKLGGVTGALGYRVEL